MACPPGRVLAYNRCGDGRSIVRERIPVMAVRLNIQVAFCVFFSVLAAARAEPPAGEAPNTDAPPRDPASIRAERRQLATALASRLGNPRYEVREEATKKLE